MICGATNGPFTCSRETGHAGVHRDGDDPCSPVWDPDDPDMLIQRIANPSESWRSITSTDGPCMVVKAGDIDA